MTPDTDTLSRLQMDRSVLLDQVDYHRTSTFNHDTPCATCEQSYTKVEAIEKQIRELSQLPQPRS